MTALQKKRFQDYEMNWQNYIVETFSEEANKLFGTNKPERFFNKILLIVNPVIYLNINNGIVNIPHSEGAFMQIINLCAHDWRPTQEEKELMETPGVIKTVADLHSKKFSVEEISLTTSLTQLQVYKIIDNATGILDYA